MKSLLALFWIALSLSQILVPFSLWLFLRYGKLDYPDDRKMHSFAVPRCGGIAVIGAYLLAVGIFILLPAPGNYVFEKYSGFLYRLIPSICFVFLTGFIDDWISLKPRYKLAGQFVAASAAYWAGIRLFDAPVGLGWLEFLITVGWLILCSNAFNLIDGTDGLAGTLGVLSCLGLVSVALSLDYYSLALVFTPLLGAILPFLRSNWPPAKLFLGDTGSLTLGFLIGCGGAVLARRFPGGEGLTAAVLILTLPLTEVLLSSLRRVLRGQSIFTADSFHIHHQLKRQGHNASAVLWQLGALSLAGTLIAVAQIWMNPWQRVCLIGPYFVYLGFKVASLRYPEFKVLGEALIGGRIRCWFRHQILLRTMEDELSKVLTLNSAISLLKSYAAQLGLVDLRINLLGTKTEVISVVSKMSNLYLVRIDLPRESWVNFRVPVDLKRTENPAGDFAGVVIRVFSLQQLEQLQPEPEMQTEDREAILVLDQFS